MGIFAAAVPEINKGAHPERKDGEKFSQDFFFEFSKKSSFFDA